MLLSPLLSHAHSSHTATLSHSPSHACTHSFITRTHDTGRIASEFSLTCRTTSEKNYHKSVWFLSWCCVRYLKLTESGNFIPDSTLKASLTLLLTLALTLSPHALVPSAGQVQFSWSHRVWLMLNAPTFWNKPSLYTQDAIQNRFWHSSLTLYNELFHERLHIQHQLCPRPGQTAW